MHKCPNCGQEFEGKFCPNCGVQWQEEKTCPKCGAKLNGSSRFCNECGYSFVEKTKPTKQPKEKQPSQIKQKLSTVGAWIKTHVKIVVPVALGLVVLIIILSLIPTFIAMQTNGTYYKYRGGKFDEETYFTLSGGKWTDEDGEKGTYKIDGENIILYVELFGSTEELATGTISNGVLSLGTGGASKDIYVKKDHKHEYGEWKTVREADCTTDGLKTRTCACGDTERDETPRFGHTGDWTVTKEATCTEEGSKKITCTVCGNEETESIEKLPHNYTDWVETKAATCTEEGINTRTCSACGKEETQNIERTPHLTSGDWQYDNDKHWKVCSVCNSNIEADHSNNSGCSICGYPLEYKKYNNTYTVSDINSTYTKPTIEIPSTYNNLPVTSIGDSAFSGCTSLTSITIPNSVTTINEFAFNGCSSLTSVSIGNSVTSIRRAAFYNCSSLENVYITDIEAWCNIDFYCSTYVANPLFYANNLYLNEELVTELVLSNSITSIESWAFWGYKSLTSITIPNSVTSIGWGAFSGCSSLTSITIPDSVTSIDREAFSYCSSLTSITIPNSVTSIGWGAFSGCSSLTSITIPDSVTSIDREAFSYCSSLTSITIPDSVTFIGGDAFYNCSNVIQTENGVKYVDKWVIGCNTSLTQANLRTETRGIADSAFSGCSSLTSITIPDSVTSIGREAFKWCSSLTSIYYAGDIASWCGISGLDDLMSSERTLYINGIELSGNLVIPNGVTSIGSYAFRGCSKLTSVTIPDSVTSIGESAFYDCTSLTSVTIPDSVTSIGESAFYDCTSLTSITIPDSVTEIGEEAFSHCSKLTSITVNENNPKFSSQDGILYNKAKTAFIHIPQALSGDITIPNSVTSIGSYAFRGCSKLTSVTIPNSVTYINWYAFIYCSSLTNITFEGTIDEWKAIEKCSDWDYNTGKYTIYCTDGEIAKDGTVTKY